MAVSDADGDFGMAGTTSGDLGVAGGAKAVTLGWLERRRWYLDGGSALKAEMRRWYLDGGGGRQQGQNAEVQGWLSVRPTETLG